MCAETITTSLGRARRSRPSCAQFSNFRVGNNAQLPEAFLSRRLPHVDRLRAFRGETLGCLPVAEFARVRSPLFFRPHFPVDRIDARARGTSRPRREVMDGISLGDGGSALWAPTNFEVSGTGRRFELAVHVRPRI